MNTTSSSILLHFWYPLLDLQRSQLHRHLLTIWSYKKTQGDAPSLPNDQAKLNFSPLEAAGICAFGDTVSFTWKLNACRDLVSSRDHHVSSRDESFHLVISRALRIAIQIAIVIADSSRDESSHLVTSRVIPRSSRDDHEMIFVVPNYNRQKDYLVGKARSFQVWYR